METRDHITRGLLEGGAARVVAVTATDVAREAARRHDASGAAAVALARGLTAGLMLATLTKDEERVTLQVLGDGPLGTLTVDATAAGTARAYVKNPAVRLAQPAGGARFEIAPAVGRSGLISVVRDVGLRDNFRGQTSLMTGEIDEDVEHYLNVSEQIESALGCEALLDPAGDVVSAAGLLVQALPGSQAAGQVRAARARLRAGALAGAMAGADDVAKLVAATLGPELGPAQLLDLRPVTFRCPCSRTRAGASLALLGQAEVAQMLVEDGRAEVTCNFCRARYEFSAEDLELIRRELDRSAGLPS
ncbi:MAG TPA: Hsp33 family molecular chaperone HslO [Polyangia bacterium]|nr:Hsp33 family molecular chaperone HslO [Polyangia bacterium]